MLLLLARGLAVVDVEAFAVLDTGCWWSVQLGCVGVDPHYEGELLCVDRPRGRGGGGTVDQERPAEPEPGE